MPHDLVMRVLRQQGYDIRAELRLSDDGVQIRLPKYHILAHVMVTEIAAHASVMPGCEIAAGTSINSVAYQICRAKKLLPADGCALTRI